MSPLRRRLTGLLAAGYAVVAVVVGGGHPLLHNHGGAHGEVVAEGAGHEHHHHDHEASHADHDHDVPEHSCPGHHHDDGHGCVVCQYLAQQPLPVAIQAAPVVSDWCQPLIPVVERQAAAALLLPHPARGPPLSA